MSAARRARRPRRRNALIDIVNGFLTLFVIGIVIVGAILFWGANRFYADGDFAEDTTFQVESGSGLSTIAQRLEDAGLIENRWIFQAGALAQKKERNVKAGEYELQAASSMADILKELTEGTPITHAVTIPEGWTSWQVAERVNANELLTGDPVEVPPEGSLMPDTYAFERGDDRATIIARMTKAQTEALAEVWAGRDPDLALETPEELVILASIVERETGVASERPQVASVFINRLKRNMRLQSDPTIIYGITRGVGTLGRGLKRSEIEQKTDYNTYQIDGLPAGPIDNPGLEALKATANPAKTKYLYFVAAGPVPSDGHLFAASYAEHRKNVAKWRAIEKQAAEEAAAAEAAKEAEQARAELEAQAAADAGDTETPPAQ